MERKVYNFDGRGGVYQLLANVTWKIQSAKPTGPTLKAYANVTPLGIAIRFKGKP